MTRARWLVAAVTAATAVLAYAGTWTNVSADPGTVIKFDTVAPVTGLFVGTSDPIRDVPGGGFPWMITGATGLLQSDGHLLVHVRGLVLADHAPVPPSLQGTNPIANFRAVVSCLDPATAMPANVSTGLFPASSDGDSTINAMVNLPSPCVAPIVFVTSPGGAWFAATGA